MTAQGKDYEFYSKFDDFICSLPNDFVQCHGSIIVNLRQVKKIENGQLHMEYGNGYIVIPVSRPYINIIKSRFKEIYM